MEEVYEDHYVINYSNYNTNGMLLGNNNNKLYPPTGKYIKEYERIELIKEINDVVKKQEDNEKLKYILKVANNCLEENKVEDNKNRLMVQVPGLLLTEGTTQNLLESYNMTFEEMQEMIIEKNLCIKKETDYDDDYFRVLYKPLYYIEHYIEQQYWLGYYDKYNRFQCYFKLRPDQYGSIATSISIS